MAYHPWTAAEVARAADGAGPYSVSIASGLADSRTYAIRLRGTGADGQVADVVLAVAVQTPASVTGSIAWVVAGTYDFRNATTSGPYTSPQTITTGGRRFRVALGTGTVQAWDVVADHWTTCHSLTSRQIAALRAAARDAA